MLTLIGNTGGKASQRHAGVRQRPLAHHFLKGRQWLFAYRVQRQGGANRGRGDGRARGGGGAVATTTTTSTPKRLRLVANGSWSQRPRRKLPVTGRPQLRRSGWPVSGSPRMVMERVVRRRRDVCPGFVLVTNALLRPTSLLCTFAILFWGIFNHSIFPLRRITTGLRLYPFFFNTPHSLQTTTAYFGDYRIYFGERDTTSKLLGASKHCGGVGKSGFGLGYIIGMCWDLS
jgi:hypothetical protein